LECLQRALTEPFSISSSPELEGRPSGFPNVRASNEGSLRPRVARAQGIARPPYLFLPSTLPPSIEGSGQGCLLLRGPSPLPPVLEAGTHVVPIARVQRGPSQGARCASTGATWVSCFSLPALASPSRPPVQCPFPRLTPWLSDCFLSVSG
jgi:hypothetical protein